MSRHATIVRSPDHLSWFSNTSESWLADPRFEGVEALNEMVAWKRWISSTPMKDVRLTERGFWNEYSRLWNLSSVNLPERSQ